MSRKSRVGVAPQGSSLRPTPRRSFCARSGRGSFRDQDDRHYAIRNLPSRQWGTVVRAAECPPSENLVRFGYYILDVHTHVWEHNPGLADELLKNLTSAKRSVQMGQVECQVSRE